MFTKFDRMFVFILIECNLLCNYKCFVLYLLSVRIYFIYLFVCAILLLMKSLVSRIC